MSGLFGLIIGVILLVAIVAIFFLTIQKIVGDPLLQQIGKIVVGVIALIAVLGALWTALFGGASAGMPNLTGQALITFAVGLLVIIAVVYILNMLIDFFGFMPEPLKYLLSIVALIAVICVAGAALFGGEASSLMSLPQQRR
jgi:hypothetical protein